MRYFLELSYNGGAYHGWQNQPNARTVQQVLETALSTILKDDISLVGAGRTDAGVHAKQMFAHFDVDDEISTSELTYKLNSFLPSDIAIHNIVEVRDNAHARFDAVSRTYIYRIARTKDVFNYDFAYGIQMPLNIDAMREASDILLEYTDFQCFSKSHTDVKTYNCIITKVDLTSRDNEIWFTITADRFLRNMVRAIVGTLVNIGLGKVQVNDMHRIIQSKNRSQAGFSVPAKGLYLVEVGYPDHIYLNK